MCSDDATKPKPIFPPIIGSYAQDVREGGVAAVAATIRMIWVGGGYIFCTSPSDWYEELAGEGVDSQCFCEQETLAVFL